MASRSSQRAVADTGGECCLTHSASCCYTRDEYRIECEHSPTGYCFAKTKTNPDYVDYTCHHGRGYANGPAMSNPVVCLMYLPVCTEQSVTGCDVEEETTPFSCDSWNVLTGPFNCGP